MPAVQPPPLHRLARLLPHLSRFINRLRQLHPQCVKDVRRQTVKNVFALDTLHLGTGVGCEGPRIFFLARSIATLAARSLTRFRRRGRQGWESPTLPFTPPRLSTYLCKENNSAERPRLWVSPPTRQRRPRERCTPDDAYAS